MKTILKAVVAASSIFVGASALADPIIVSVTLDGNDCGTVLASGSGFSTCRIYGDLDTNPDTPEQDISSIIAKYEEDDSGGLVWEKNSGAYPNFDETLMSFTGGLFSDNAGSWTYTGAEPGIKYWVAKGGNQFTVFYQISQADFDACGNVAMSYDCLIKAQLVTSGTWSSAGGGLSHLSWYNSEIRVPEPATIALLGLGLLGFALMRRRA